MIEGGLDLSCGLVPNNYLTRYSLEMWCQYDCFTRPNQVGASPIQEMFDIYNYTSMRVEREVFATEWRVPCISQPVPKPFSQPGPTPGRPADHVDRPPYLFIYWSHVWSRAYLWGLVCVELPLWNHNCVISCSGWVIECGIWSMILTTVLTAVFFHVLKVGLGLENHVWPAVCIWNVTSKNLIVSQKQMFTALCNSWRLGVCLK